MLSKDDPLQEPPGAARVEIVDTLHKGWPLVLKMLDELGQRDSLVLDEDGWLPARQRMVVAFVGDKPAAHLSFHIHAVDRQHLEARLDAVGFAPKAAARQLSRVLREAAEDDARALRCGVFKGIDAVEQTAQS